MENSKKACNYFYLAKKKIMLWVMEHLQGNVILNYCNITNKNISYICDANPIKEGKFTPEHIEIISKRK